MGKLYICRGLPGSGKTFWARQFVSDRGFLACRVNRDDLRSMAHNGVFSPEREFFILRDAVAMVSQGLMSGYDVISDDTNLQNHSCKQLITAATLCGRQVEWVLFETPIDVCIARDKRRFAPASVGEQVIRQMAASVDSMTPEMASLPATIVYPDGTYRDPQETEVRF